MIFRTEIKLKPSSSTISHKKSVFLIGSCFSDNIGSLFSKNKFQVSHNPFGISYNPISIAQQLKRIATQKPFDPSDLFNDKGVYKSFELHSSQAGMEQDLFLSDLNKNIQASHDQLKKASHLFITFGTAWVYALKSSGQIVNNCHKIPSNQFEKKLLNMDEIISSYNDIIHDIKSVNSEINIVFTVSPVRHLRDGIENNSLSKSILRLVIHQLCESFDAFYFPSNEILLDDLRDYRFYKTDLIHPNEMAIDYIWEKLSSVFFNEETSSLNNELEAIRKAVEHKAFQPKSLAHQEFIQKTIGRVKKMQEKFPEINLEEELKLLSNKLSE